MCCATWDGDSKNDVLGCIALKKLLKLIPGRVLHRVDSGNLFHATTAEFALGDLDRLGSGEKCHDAITGLGFCRLCPG